jgi:hypothetical protein
METAGVGSILKRAITARLSPRGLPVILPVLIASVAGGIHRHPPEVIASLQEEHRLRTSKLPAGRLRLSDTERHWLAALAEPLGRKRLRQLAPPRSRSSSRGCRHAATLHVQRAHDGSVTLEANAMARDLPKLHGKPLEFTSCMARDGAYPF